MVRQVLLVTALLFGLAKAYMFLERVDREILKSGLHRTLRTNVTYTTDLEADIKSCSWVFRENITKDQYIYYEEVT